MLAGNTSTLVANMIPTAIYLFYLLVQCSALTSGHTCITYVTCGTCIAAGCSWCKQENYNHERCLPKSIHTENGCEDIFGSTNSVHIHNSTVDAVQLFPQNISIRMRPNSTVKFNITFHQAENYPVDLYFLMDVSFSMIKLRNTLVTLSDTLASTLQQLTANYRLGLGTFMDKTRMPFVNTEVLSSWCPGCIEPYSFKNQLPLTDSVLNFKTKMNQTGSSGNIDTPEGVLDALMQSAVCTNQIGWRDQSRKMVVVSTDGQYHYGGDGLLGGLIESNDEQCHLDVNGTDVYSSYQDYPSVCQLARKIKDKNINVIFTIAEKVQLPYARLSEHIEGSAVGVLTEDCGNVVDLIRDNYKKISGTVSLKVEKSDAVDVMFQSNCNEGAMMNTPTCKHVLIGQNVTFLTTVTLPDAACPVDETDWFQTIQINPIGLSERLTVNIEMDCRCPCESPDSQTPRSPKCSGHGTLQCGLCSCDEGFYGERCECSLAHDEQACRRNGSSQICEDHGKCVCGICECHSISSTSTKKFSGNFCECNDYKCDYFNGEMCGGDSRGSCSCGQCRCKQGWAGDRCDCSTDDSLCKANNGKICNGKGSCECGKCSCTSGVLFTGPTCETCPTCAGECEQYYKCVRCHFGLEGQTDCSPFCSSNVLHMDALTDAAESWSKNETVECVVPLDSLCHTSFVYNSDFDALAIKKNKICEEKQKNIYVVISVIVGIVISGVLSVCIWKAFVTFYDFQEYARFEEERRKATFGATENPLYKNATSTYNNPTFSPGGFTN